MSTFPTVKSQEFADAVRRMKDDYASLRTSISDVRGEWSTISDEDKSAAEAIIVALASAISIASEELESIYMDATDEAEFTSTVTP